MPGLRQNASTAESSVFSRSEGDHSLVRMRMRRTHLARMRPLRWRPLSVDPRDDVASARRAQADCNLAITIVDQIEHVRRRRIPRREDRENNAAPAWAKD